MISGPLLSSSLKTGERPKTPAKGKGKPYVDTLKVISVSWMTDSLATGPSWTESEPYSTWRGSSKKKWLGFHVRSSYVSERYLKLPDVRGSHAGWPGKWHDSGSNSPKHLGEMINWLIQVQSTNTGMSVFGVPRLMLDMKPFSCHEMGMSYRSALSQSRLYPRGRRP